MILVDYNQFLLASLFASIGNHHNAEINEDMVRHMFLNSIRSCRRNFMKDYGEIVICADGKNSWRKAAFPYYKANRKKSREESEIDWGDLFRIMHMILEEMKQYFPYKVLHFDELEADDIIGTLAHEFGTEMNFGNEKILILSGDRDFVQLQKYRNVFQYDQIRKKNVVHSNPDEYLFEHILKGDTGDGIPNILSEDNCLVVGKRQRPMTEKRITAYKTNPSSMEEMDRIRFERNQRLIDLNCIPDKYRKMVLDEYTQERTVGRKHLFSFFTSKRLKNLLSDINDF
jgi:hypothetical protein